MPAGTGSWPCSIMPAEVRAKLAAVRGRIAEAAARAGRDPAGITIVAVSKGVPAERLVGLPVPAGENRVQELVAKQAALATSEIEWHFIGSLQRNKVGEVVGRVALIHSVDRMTLARAIAARASEAGIVQDVLVQVNTSGEQTKHGFAPDDAPDAVPAVAGLAGLRVRGLMTMAPEGDPAAAAACFDLARLIRDRVVGGVPEARALSMGMSGDLESAVERGATIVRVGRAIFGPRAP